MGKENKQTNEYSVPRNFPLSDDSLLREHHMFFRGSGDISKIIIIFMSFWLEIGVAKASLSQLRHP